MAHTPGPWKVVESEHSFSIVDPTNTIISVSGISQPHGYVPPDDNSYDNGRLLAVAPELLKELKRLLVRYECIAEYYGFDHSMHSDPAREIICKAEGLG